jgi:hypothetical protein
LQPIDDISGVGCLSEWRTSGEQLPQCFLVGLANCSKWDALHDLDSFGCLDWALPRPDERRDIGNARFWIAKHYGRNDDLAPTVIRNTKDACAGDAGMRLDHIFHRTRVNVEPAGDDHVFGSIDKAKKTIWIADCDIAGMQPTTSKRLHRLIGLVKISAHQERPADTQLSRLAIGNLGTIQIQQAYFGIGDGATA